MSTITVRFIGICCFVDNANDNTKRVVLPVDNRADERGDGPHIPYLEMEVVDEPWAQGPFADERLYVRDLVTYRRLHLSGDRITITNSVRPDGAKPNILSSYDDRVPSLTQLTPALPANAAAGILAGPDPATVAAYFDITHGDLHSGPPNLFPTRFSGMVGTPRRLAQWVELQLQFPDDVGPAIEVQGFGPDSLGARTIQLDPRTSRITIGNQLAGDIERNTGDPMMPRAENFRRHFQLYYDVLSNVPPDPSLPEATAALPNGCVGTQFP